VNLFWIISMLIMWVNGFVLISKGRKLKINSWTVSGIVVTLLNFLTPPICMTTSNDILMVVLTLLWLISPIAALFIAISKRREYIEKMTKINFAVEDRESSVVENDSFKKEDVPVKNQQAAEPVKEDVSVTHTDEKLSKLEDRLRKLK
ncbi:MAG: hypothetical protein J6V03_05430, partial [Clostridia bacterium]|nr:hypothetical protein [Clostridia bacterium]